MIKRIQVIKNVGTFTDTRPASIELSKLIFLYGPNSQGKTTLCDIFKSLMEKSNNYITERKTVGQKDDQQISISFGDKRTVEFKNDSWTCNGKIPELDNINIFDTEFVYNNVFTNSHIEYKNKENFTKFVIGDESVKLSIELQKLNENKKNLENDLEIYEQKIIKKLNGIIDLVGFIKSSYREDVSDEDLACLGLLTSIKEQKNNKLNIGQIKKLPLPIEVNLLKLDKIDLIEKTNTILSSCISFGQEDLLKTFEKHKQECIRQESKNIDPWIISGLSLIKNDKCPFCGTSTTGNHIIESYFKLFSEEVAKYNQRICSLKETKIEFSLSLDPTIYKNETAISELNAKVYDPDITEQLGKIISIRNLLTDKIEFANLQIVNYLIDLENKITSKLSNPYDKIDIVEITNIKSYINEINKILLEYNLLITNYNNNIINFKDNLSEESISKHIEKMEIEYKKNSIIVLRNQLNDDILSINKLKDEINVIACLSKSKKIQFDKEQKVYLDTFYKDINDYFYSFGSRNYKIEKSITAKGTNKTYSLDLYYREKKVPAEKIQFVLSESDRRALALSIFFTKIKATCNKNSIIILDDPITSFDLERMNVFINKLKEICDNVDQIIITTHYQSFFKKLVSLTRNYNPTLLKIKPDIVSNSIVKVEVEKESLLMDEYEHALYEMTTFMDGTSHSYSEVSARTLMQKYIEYHFVYELRESKYDDLSSLIKIIFESNYIDDDLYKKLNNKREEYNDPAHQFETDTEEQKRISVIELYNILQKI